MRIRSVITLLALLSAAACEEPSAPAPLPLAQGPAPELEPSEPVLKRLTTEQYRNAMLDLFGSDLALPASLEPDVDVEGLYAVGASVTTISPLGVEQYEDAAYLVAEQVMGEPERREALVPCQPEGTVDDVCAAATLEELGLRAWRRPLSEAELDTLVDLSALAADTLGDFHAGLAYGVAALLQSPNFLYRVELGEPDPDVPGERRYTDWEMASRLAFFLWNSIPDAALLEDAAAGRLTEEEGLADAVGRMLEDERTRSGVRSLYADMLDLHRLEELSKDPLVFTAMSDEVGSSAREETLRGIEALVFEEDGDYRELFTTHRTYLDRKLAQLYNVPAPTEDFSEVWLPVDGTRRGLLGQVSFLALQAHAVSTSVTRRGAFVRTTLLCQTIPPPPADVATTIPEATDDAPTMRDRVAIHLEDPVCASCHELTDPIGLGLENFDGLGQWRTHENGVEIDPSGELDGDSFANAYELADALYHHPSLGPCMVRTAYKYATATLIGEGEEDLVEWHAANFAIEGHRVQALLADIAMSPGFRRAGEVE